MAEARETWDWTRDIVHERTGITDRSQREIEQGKRGFVQPDTLKGIKRGFGLDDFKVARIMSGDPVPVPELPPADNHQPRGESSDVWDELTDLRRRLVEAEVRTDMRFKEMDQKLDQLRQLLAPDE